MCLAKKKRKKRLVYKPLAREKRKLTPIGSHFKLEGASVTQF